MTRIRTNSRSSIVKINDPDIPVYIDYSRTEISVGSECGIIISGKRLIGTYAGSFDPSLGLPTTGTGPGGQILKSDFWDASGSGTIVGLSPFTDFEIGDIIISKVKFANSVDEFFGNKGTDGGGSGGAGDSVKIQIEAGENIGGHRLVLVNSGLGFLFQNTEANYKGVVGFSTAAYNTGEDATIQLSGIINNPGWTLTQDGIYYANDNGLIALTPPSSGLWLIVGIAIDSDNLLIKIGEEIILN